MAPDIPHLVQQLGWPAVVLVFIAWMVMRAGKFMGPLMKDLVDSHVSMMHALEHDAKEKTRILDACKDILQSHSVSLVGISEKLDEAL